MTMYTRKENFYDEECNESRSQDVYIWDVTLRENELSGGITFNRKEKLEIASFMSEMGVHAMDISFPSKSFHEGDFIREIVARNLNITLNASVMNSVGEIDLCSELGIKETNVLLPINKLCWKSKSETGSPDSFSILKKVMGEALKKNISVNLIGVDSTRMDPAYVAEIFGVGFDLGAQRFVICDTAGIMEPYGMGEFVSNVRMGMPREAVLGIHCHNNFGLATANTLAAVDAGVKFVSVSVNGLGEGAGNASLEEVVLALEKIHKKKTGINLNRLLELSKLVENLSGVPIPISKPIVGHNVACYAFNNYVTAMLKNQGFNEGFDGEAVGSNFDAGGETDSCGSSVCNRPGGRGLEIHAMELDSMMEKIKVYIGNLSKLEKENYLQMVLEHNQKLLGFPLDAIKRILHESIRH